MNRDGYGIEYDIENDGKQKIEGYWLKDKLIRRNCEFDVDNNQMIEYAENNDENGKYVQKKTGYLLDEASGTAIRESEWEIVLKNKEGID